MAPVIIKTSTPDANGGNPLNAYSLDLGSGAADVLPGVLVDPDALKPIGSGAGSVGLPISGPADLTVTGTLTNIGDTAAIALAGRRGVGFTTAPNGAGTFVVDVSMDGGVTYSVGNGIPLWSVDDVKWRFVAQANYNPATFLVVPVPATHLRVRATGVSGGPYTVKLVATARAPDMTALWVNSANDAIPSLLFRGLDIGGTAQNIKAAALGGGQYGLAANPMDGNSGAVQAVKAASTPAVAADPAAVVALSPNSPPATGIADTLFASGDVASPSAGAAIATLTTPAAGTYRLDLNCYSYVGNLVASIGPDMELRKGAVAQINKLGGISAAKDGTVTPGVAGTPSRFTNLRVTLDGSTNLSINATAGGTANYVAQLMATRLA